MKRRKSRREGGGPKKFWGRGEGPMGLNLFIYLFYYLNFLFLRNWEAKMFLGRGQWTLNNFLEIFLYYQNFFPVELGGHGLP
jgi:hypothetical protein